MKKGLLIAFEGPDGSGKTTQIELLKEYFAENNYEFFCTREPGGTRISEKIREIILDNSNKEMNPMCEALLYAASRAQVVNEVIVPKLNEGKIVLCDRFVDSSIVYQGIGRDLGIERIRNINEAATNGLKPDFTFMFSISYEEGLRRKKKQKKLDRLENGDIEFHRRVFEGYKKIIKESANVKIINAEKSIEDIHNEIINDILSLLNKK